MNIHHHGLSDLSLLGILALAGAPAWAQTVYQPENDVTPYTGDEIDPHSGDVVSDGLQRYRVFLPEDPEGTLKPVGGWPVLIHFDLSQFLVSTDYEVIDPMNDPMVHPGRRFSKFLALVLDNKIAVITALATPSVNVGTWNPAVPPPGEGRFHPPEQMECPQFDYLRPLADSAEKDAIMLIQHVRRYAGDPTSQYADHMRDLDRTRVAVHGESAGAIALMWIAFGPDRRSLFDPATNPLLPAGDWTGQYDKKTRPDIAILREGAVWFRAQMEDEPGYHFSDQGTCAMAATLANVNDDTLDASSALYYEQPVVGLNNVLPTYLYYKDMFDDDTMDCLGTTGICNEENHTQSNVHSAWHGIMWWSRHQNAVLALVTAAEDLDPSTLPGTTVNLHDLAAAALAAVYPSSFVPHPPDEFRAIVPGNDALNAPNANMVGWLKDELQALLPNPWTQAWTLYRPQPGCPSPPPCPPTVPTQFGPNGVLAPANNVLLPISSVPPAAWVELWIAAWPTTIIDSGCGDMIVNPELVIPLQADANGRLNCAIRWEDLPSEVANVFQVIVADPEEPCGFTISQTWIADTELGS